MTENRIRDGKLFAEGVAVIHVGREWVTLRLVGKGYQEKRLGLQAVGAAG